MKALSVRQPWPHAIFHMGKDVENRSWPTRFRGRIAVHVAKWIDVAECRRLNLDPHTLPTGYVIGHGGGYYVRGACSKWAQRGIWHWLLNGPRLFRKPIPTKGKLGLFEWKAVYKLRRKITGLGTTPK
jgi:hypothetical protein